MLIKVGDTIINLDNVVGAKLHTKVFVCIGGKYQDVADGVILVTNASSSDGNYTFEFGGDEANALRQYLKAICMADVMLAPDPNEPPF